MLRAVRLCLTVLVLLASPWCVAQSNITPWPKDKPTPMLELSDMQGRTWRLDQLQGKVVLINFWATWCEPCREEMPSLVALSRQYPDQLVVLAVNYQENAPKIQRFLDLVPLTFPVLLDRDGVATRAWTRRVFPTTVLVDAKGRAQLMVVGEFDWAGAQAQRLIRPWLKSTSVPQVSLL